MEPRSSISSAAHSYLPDCPKSSLLTSQATIDSKTACRRFRTYGTPSKDRLETLINTLGSEYDSESAVAAA